MRIIAKKVTSKRVAKIASKILRNKRQDKKSKIAAASDLSQREKRKKVRNNKFLQERRKKVKKR